jgi:hypothetical protein
MNNIIKPLAFYLPQYHPIKENDEWWGTGFTEWTNVTKATPLYKGHKQPKLPADLGYYDLRVRETRQQQADLARKYGIHGFIYYHYWFGDGKMLLEKPMIDIIASKEPDFPFCLCWANQTWTGIWHGAPKTTLIEQKYPGEEDMRKHLEYLIPIFTDQRYIKVDGKPLFVIYDVLDLPEPRKFTDAFRRIAKEMGIPDLYMMAANLVADQWDYKGNGFDAKISNGFNEALGTMMSERSILKKVKSKFAEKMNAATKPRMVDHVKLSEITKTEKTNVDTYPMVLPNWDNTPRSGTRGVVLTHSSPKLFEHNTKRAIGFLRDNQGLPEKFLIVKSWNEWAEGNYLEPDREYGHAYLESFSQAMKNNTE